MGIFNKLFGSSNNNKLPQPSAEMMPEDMFWRIIHDTYNMSVGDFAVQNEKLKQVLEKMPLKDIVLFENRLRQLHDKAYNWQLWAVVYIIIGGCGDDSFMDFRHWLIAQGRATYYSALNNPETLADIEEERININWEGFGYIPSAIYENLTGQNIPALYFNDEDISGEEWEEEDLPEMFPELYAKYNDEE